MSPPLSPILLLSSPTVSQVEVATPRRVGDLPLVNFVTVASQALPFAADRLSGGDELLYQRSIQLNVW